jgi:carbon monoxide dehydrogenase subunit G
LLLTGKEMGVPEISETFQVSRRADDVWSLFQDVPAVADCIPGAALEDSPEEGVYRGALKVKLGAIQANFKGEARHQEINEVARSGNISARGVDRNGGNRASVLMSYGLSDLGTETEVHLTASIKLQGPLAQFGRTGIMEEVSSRLTKEFAECLEAKLSAQTPEDARSIAAAEVKGFRLMVQALLARLRSVLVRRGKK